jgi:hypothetical protein
MSVPLRVCLLALAVFLIVSCTRKADPVESAKAFFALVANGRTDEAYETTALGFKAQQSDKLFAQTCRELGLGNVLTITSAPPEFEGNTAKLAIEISSKTGEKSPLTVTMVDERGAWRIFSVRAPRSLQTGIAANLFGTVGKGRGFTDGVSRPKPTDEETRKLVEDILMLFNRCVKERAFDSLYEEVSDTWQDQLTKGQLKRAFQGFIDKQIDLSHIQGAQPTFAEPPAVSTEGLLVVQGYYVGQPTNTLFSMKFIYETPKWRLFGLDVSLAKALEEEPQASAPANPDSLPK